MSRLRCFTATPWHGMTLPVWYKLLQENRFRVAPTRWPLAISVTAMAMFNSIAHPISEALMGWRAGTLHLTPPPIFVIGHWRSGTTLLHELLVTNPHLGYATTFQCTSPSHFPLTQPWLPHLFGWTLSKQRVMDQMSLGFESPQEDEFALCNLGVASPYRFWAFPDRRRDVGDHLTLAGLPHSQLEEWKRALLWFLKRVSLTERRRLVLKSPTHTCRVSVLRELFPESKFVHIVRDPYQSIPSTIHTWNRISDSVGLRAPDAAVVERVVLESFRNLYSGFAKQVDGLADECFCELRFEDLIADPVEVVGRLIAEMNLSGFRDMRPAIEDYFAARASYQPNRHDIDPALRALINEVAGDYMQRYGYDHGLEPAH